MDEVTFFQRLYAQFNAREIESVLASLTPEVLWANGMEGGHEHGRDAVRAYWKRHACQQYTLPAQRRLPEAVQHPRGQARA